MLLPDTVSEPRILGILNLSPDSFSDGGLYTEPGAAILHARHLVSEGADAIDVGAVSSNPDAKPLSTEAELERLRTVIGPLQNEGISLSIDSFHPDVHLALLEDDSVRVDFLNDIRGFPEPAIYEALARSSCRLILMHSIQQGIASRESWQGEGSIVDHILRFFEKRLGDLCKAGIAKKRIILDPGMGFFLGGEARHSFEVLASLPRFRREFGCELLVSVSRKSFLGSVTGREVSRRGAATLTAELWCAVQGADWLRTHEPGAIRDGLRVWKELLSFSSAGRAK